METRLKYLLNSKFAPATGVPLAESSASGDRHVSIVLGPAGLEQDMKPCFARTEIFIYFF